MSSSIYSHFFKKENSNLTVEDIRKAGYLAGETKTGFIEVALWSDAINIAIQSNPDEDYDHDLCILNMRNYLIDNLKPNTPPLMSLRSDTFGGLFDCEPKLNIYKNSEIKISKYDNFCNDSPAQLIFGEYYPNEKGYFDTVGFARDTDNLETKEQRQWIKDKQKELKEQDYQEWIQKQNDLSIKTLSLKAFEHYKNLKDTLNRLDYEKKEHMLKEVKYIEQYIMENY